MEKAKKILPPLMYNISYINGSDPELFIEEKRGVKKYIIGSEKIIPKNGLVTHAGDKVIRDGVQVEFNPKAYGCRQSHSIMITNCFKELKKVLNENQTINLEPLVKMTKKEMNTLSPRSKEFGCAPSFNYYTNISELVAPDIDASTYMYRGAGGHLHFGINSFSKTQLKKLVPILDILVGNTCVLMDRHKGNIERRRIYGKAGEFRLPIYKKKNYSDEIVKTNGLEYRTLSNFWLQHYILYSLVSGLSRIAIQIVGNTTKDFNYIKELTKLVSKKDIQDAINNNDFDLAYKNFQKVKVFISKYVKENSYGLNADSLVNFELFIKKPLKHWFPKDAMFYWADRSIYGSGAEVYFRKKPVVVKCKVYRAKDD